MKLAAPQKGREEGKGRVKWYYTRKSKRNNEFATCSGVIQYWGRGELIGSVCQIQASFPTDCGLCSTLKYRKLTMLLRNVDKLSYWQSMRRCKIKQKKQKTETKNKQEIKTKTKQRPCWNSWSRDVNRSFQCFSFNRLLRRNCLLRLCVQMGFC